MEQTGIDKYKTDPAAPAAETGKAVATEQRTKTAQKKRRTFGNKVFDLTVWPSIQWFGVWVMSLVVADRAKNKTGIANQWFEKATSWVTTELKKFGTDNENPRKIFGRQTSYKEDWAKGLVLIFALSLGGSMLVPVTKFLEDRRQRIASWIDKHFGKNALEEDLARPEPKQTWGSMLKGRLAALTTVYGAFLLVGPSTMDAIQKRFGKNVTDEVMKAGPIAKRFSEKRVGQLAELAVFDLFFTAITASFHYLVSRITASKKQEKLLRSEVDTVKSAVAVLKEEEKNLEHIESAQDTKQPSQEQSSKPWSTNEKIIRPQETTVSRV